uniref:G-protein coupled receptors family 1 profile domain-containing protein n=1 Tax=Acrobeloides nanus TaxID=290746 RepID=A0A914DIQ0_9BILA
MNFSNIYVAPDPENHPTQSRVSNPEFPGLSTRSKEIGSASYFGYLSTPKMSQPVEYVTVGDTIADIANKASTSTSLTTTTSILLSILVMVSFIANALLVATILSSYKLRNCLLYVCFVNIALLNILDTLFIMFISILYLANGQWCFGDILCRINALMQQFIFLKTLLAITLMAMERALGLVANGHRLLAPKYVLTLSLMFTIVASCFAAPLIFSSFPVSPYPHRYLCAIASYSPIAYTIVQIWVYSGCLFVLLICFGSMIRHSQVSRSLPIKPQDYSAFIMETRALQDHLSMGKLVFYIMLTYLIVQGPYIVLNFFMQ